MAETGQDVLKRGRRKGITICYAHVIYAASNSKVVRVRTDHQCDRAVLA